MPSWIKSPFIFSSTALTGLLLSLLIKVDTYEYAVSHSLDNYRISIPISKSFCSELDPLSDEPFHYWSEGISRSANILSLIRSEDFCHLIVSDEVSHPKLFTISFRSGTNSLLSELFSQRN